MTTVDHRRAGAPLPTVDLAGTAWPLYKLEALALGVLLFLAVLVITRTLQTAVLAAAASTVVVWWARRLHYTRRRP